MFGNNIEKAKEKIKTSILNGVDLPEKNEVITREVLDKIIDNLVLELVKIKAISNQAMYR